jgi:hypothetical protein
VTEVRLIAADLPCLLAAANADLYEGDSGKMPVVVNVGGVEYPLRAMITWEDDRLVLHAEFKSND